MDRGLRSSCVARAPFKGYTAPALPGRPSGHLCPDCSVHGVFDPPLVHLVTTEPLEDVLNVSIGVHFESGEVAGWREQGSHRLLLMDLDPQGRQLQRG